jgi:hypothetical protein
MKLLMYPHFLYLMQVIIPCSRSEDFACVKGRCVFILLTAHVAVRRNLVISRHASLRSLIDRRHDLVLRKKKNKF